MNSDAFVLKTAQTETQLLQHLDLQALGKVINDKLGALNIQQYAYTA
jgi:hypothetical protein